MLMGFILSCSFEVCRSWISEIMSHYGYALSNHGNTYVTGRDAQQLLLIRMHGEAFRLP